MLNQPKTPQYDQRRPARSASTSPAVGRLSSRTRRPRNRASGTGVPYVRRLYANHQPAVARRAPTAAARCAPTRAAGALARRPARMIARPASPTAPTAIGLLRTTIPLVVPRRRVRRQSSGRRAARRASQVSRAPLAAAAASLLIAAVMNRNWGLKAAAAAAPKATAVERVSARPTA